MKVDKQCSECNKKMIKRYDNRVFASNPPQYPWYWWCGCGNTESGGVERGKTEEETYMEIWENENKTGNYHIHTHEPGEIVFEEEDEDK
jgi:hypothetical protein